MSVSSYMTKYGLNSFENSEKKKHSNKKLPTDLN